MTRIRVTNHAVERFKSRFSEMRDSGKPRDLIIKLCLSSEFTREQNIGTRKYNCNAFVNGRFLAIVKRIDFNDYLVVTVIKK